MRPHRPLLAVVVACLASQLAAFPAVSGMRTEGVSGDPMVASADKGASPAEARPAMPVRPTTPYVGTVVTTRGSRSIAEIQGGARKGEKFVVYDERLRKCGECTVILVLDKELFLLEPTDGRQAATGHRLARAEAPK